MKFLSNAILSHRKFVLILFCALAAVSILFGALVEVNYKIADYLPDDAQSTTAIRIMRDEFGKELPNARVLITDVTVNEALS